MKTNTKKLIMWIAVTDTTNVTVWVSASHGLEVFEVMHNETLCGTHMSRQLASTAALRLSNKLIKGV